MVSKLARFSEKDKQFVEGYSKRAIQPRACYRAHKKTKLEAELQEQAMNFVRGLQDMPKSDAAQSS